MKRPYPYQSESRQASQSALIVFAIIYVGVFFSTLFVHNGFIARPFRQSHGPAPPLSGRKDAQIPKEKVSRQTTYDGRPSAVLGEITDGETITSMLLGEIPFPADTEAQRLRFQPGTLNLTQAHTLRHCYADPIYQSHYPSSDRQVTSVSDYYKLLYLLIPKAGSSTGRWIMENVLRGGNVGLNPAGDDLIRKYRNYTVLTFVRDPLDRFYSQYDELFLRYGPWMQKKEGRAWKGLKRFRHPYPYLYENMTVWEDYQSLFCPLHKVNDVDHTTQWCSMQQTKDNGPLASRFERFVWDYNGVSPWDLVRKHHLRRAEQTTFASSLLIFTFLFCPSTFICKYLISPTRIQADRGEC